MNEINVSKEMDKLFWLGWTMMFVMYPVGIVALAWFLCWIIGTTE